MTGPDNSLGPSLFLIPGTEIRKNNFKINGNNFGGYSKLYYICVNKIKITWNKTIE